MRKYLKNDILEMLHTMYEAHDNIRVFIDGNDSESAVTVLSDCQEAAIQIGSILDETEGEGTSPIHFLEEYCETVYQVAVSLSDGIGGSDGKQRLDEALTKAEYSVKNDIRTTLEVVFLPYKASMWDSMESVWQAAANDPDCDVYVIPIPYYDRRPDNSFGEYHYEGTEIPEYVPITHYAAYDFENRRPDVVYVHNPYDQYNYVTSVEPRFYSYELKKHTDCLVYIPYYLAYGSIGDGQRMTSVYRSADYIVIQNEGYRKFFDKNIPDSKFLPLGSPKFDKIVTTCKNKPELKPEWKMAESKRVFFYNTSISEFLCNPAAFLRKMSYVFDTFERYKQDVCLLWRPHPLLESTMKSMCPQYLSRYLELKNRYISDSLGIYDDNPDLNYSIALSDVYLGDASSSVASSFSAVGKPLFLLSPHISSLPSDSDRTKYAVQYMAADKNYDDTSKHICLLFGNLLFVEQKDFSFRYLDMLSETYTYLLQHIVVGDKIYICPQNARDIVILDKNNNISRVNIIPTEEMDGAYFSSAVHNDRYICLIPDKYHSAVIFDTQSGKCEYISSGIAELNTCSYRRPYKGGCIHNNILYITYSMENKIWTYNLLTKKTNVIALDVPESKGFVFADSDGESVWLMSHIGCAVTRWNPVTGKIAIISEFDFEINCLDPYFCSDYIEQVFSSVFFNDRYAYFTPGFGDKFIKIDKVTNKAIELNFNIPELFTENTGYNYSHLNSWFMGRSSSGNALFVSTLSGKIFELNTVTDEISEVSYDIDSEKIRELSSGFLYYSDYARYCCLENGFVSLKNIIENDIKVNPHNKEEQLRLFSCISNNLDGSCGYNVHCAVKNNIIK